MNENLNPALRHFLAGIDMGNERPSGGRTAVDVGCGDGAFLEAALSAIPGWTAAFGIDPAFDAVVAASARFERDMRVSFLQAPGDALPLRDECADVVLMARALHHLEKPAAALAEIRRILRPGGAFVLFEQASDGNGIDHALWDEYHMLRGRIDLLAGGYMRPLYSVDGIDAIVSSSGFEKRRRVILDGRPLETDDALATMGEAIRRALAPLPQSAERQSILDDAARTLGAMEGVCVMRPDQYLGEWKKEKPHA